MDFKLNFFTFKSHFIDKHFIEFIIVKIKFIKFFNHQIIIFSLITFIIMFMEFYKKLDLNNDFCYYYNFLTTYNFFFLINFILINLELIISNK